MIKTTEDWAVILEANVLKVFSTETKGWWFEVKKVKVEFPSKSPDFPNQVLLEQTGNKIALCDNLQEWRKYRFYIDFSAKDWNETCFWRIQAWKVEDIDSDLPF